MDGWLWIGPDRKNQGIKGSYIMKWLLWRGNEQIALSISILLNLFLFKCINTWSFPLINVICER